MSDAVLKVFNDFKVANDERFAQLEAKGVSDPLLEKKVDTINDALDVALVDQKKAFDDLEARINAMGMSGALATDEEKAAKAYSVAFNDFVRRGQSGITDALSVGSDPDGGYSVPSEVDSNVTDLERDEVSMRRLANVISLSTEDYTKLVNVHGATSGWVDETDARGETGTPVLKALKPFFGEIYANPAVTQKMLDDSSFDVESWLASELASDFAEEENGKFLTGNGIVSPKGILAYTTALTADATRTFGTLQHVITGKAAAFLAATATVSPADCLIDMQTALKTAFRGNAKWLMNSATVGTVRKFKDAVNGEYIWQPGIVAGQPSMLLGKPVEEDEAMPAIGAGLLPILYGDFKRTYTICDRIGTRIIRDNLTNKPYIHFYTTKRLGGFVTNFNSVKVLMVSA